MADAQSTGSIVDDGGVIIEVTEPDYDPFKERTVAVIRPDGGLSVRYEYLKEDERHWRSWQDQGASLGPAGVKNLKKLLDEKQEN